MADPSSRWPHDDALACLGGDGRIIASDTSVSAPGVVRFTVRLENRSDRTFRARLISRRGVKLSNEDARSADILGSQ